MTVYELIQELAKYDADDEVEFLVDEEFDCDVDIRHSGHTVHIDLEY